MKLPNVGRLVTTIIRALGGLGPGKATVVGVVGTAAGAALAAGAPFIGGVVNSENIVPLVQIAADVIKAFFALVGAFGIGRKAGATAEYLLSPRG